MRPAWVGGGRDLNLRFAVCIHHPGDQLAVGGESGLTDAARLLQFRDDAGDAWIDSLACVGSERDAKAAREGDSRQHCKVSVGTRRE